MWRKWFFLLLSVGALLAPSVAARAQGGYELPWWTVDGGGASALTGDGYSLGATVGQGDAGVLAGGGYTLGGGFWKGGAAGALPYAIYLPLVLR